MQSSMYEKLSVTNINTKTLLGSIVHSVIRLNKNNFHAVMVS